VTAAPQAGIPAVDPLRRKSGLAERAKRVYRGYGIYERRTAGIRHVPVMRLRPL
jgi:hypothetical protein